MERDLLTNSSISVFKQCRKRYHWSYILGIRPTHDAKALRIGSAVHAGLDCLQCGGHPDTAVDLVRGYYDNCPDAYDLLDWQIERETVATLVSCYSWRWPEPLKMIASENSWTQRIRNNLTDGVSTVFDVAGKMDGIVTIEDGRLAVLETKTVSEDLSMESGYWQRLQLDHQITLYLWAARQLGYNVATVLYNVLRKPTIGPTAVAVCDDLGAKIVLDQYGERVRTERGQWRQTSDSAKGYTLQTRAMTPEEWSIKLANDIGERPDFYYSRREIPRMDGDIEEFLTELWDTQKTIRAAMNEDRWYRTVSFSTCPHCAYWGLCSSKYNFADTLPEGYVIVSDIHPELKQ